MTHISKQYVHTSFGQIHLRKINAVNDQYPALVCLHPAPSSGLYFTTVMPMLNTDRQVIALDYLGYGGSARQDVMPGIADYAAAMTEAISNLGIHEPYDLMGFHTGCLVANEMALSQPELIRRLVLCDVPYFVADVRTSMQEKFAQPMALTEDLQSIAEIWKFNVASRIGDVPIQRAVELLAEHLRTGDHDHFAFHAAFDYACEERFAGLQANTTVIATQSAMLDPSRSAAEIIPGAQLVEALEITTAVFESGAQSIAARIITALDA